MKTIAILGLVFSSSCTLFVSANNERDPEFVDAAEGEGESEGGEGEGGEGEGGEGEGGEGEGGEGEGGEGEGGEGEGGEGEGGEGEGGEGEGGEGEGGEGEGEPNCGEGPVLSEGELQTQFASELYPLLIRPFEEGGCIECHSADSDRVFRMADDAASTYVQLRVGNFFEFTPRSLIGRVQNDSMPPEFDWPADEKEILSNFTCAVSRAQTLPAEEERLNARIWRLTPEQVQREILAIIPQAGNFSDLPGVQAEFGFTNIARNGAIDQTVATRLIQIANEVADNIRPVPIGANISGCDNLDFGCLDAFLPGFAARFYRRPLTPAESAELIQRHDDMRWTYGAPYAFAAIVQRLIMSPYFIYRTELGASFEGEVSGTSDAGESIVVLSNHEIATLMAFGLTDRGPDALLKQAADEGLLRDPQVRRSHAQRLLDNAAPVWQRFFWEWLGYSEFDTQVAAHDTPSELSEAMRNEFMQFISRTVTDNNGSLDDVFTEQRSYTVEALAEFYGVEHNGEGVQEITFSGSERAGILTQAAWLVSHSSQEDEFVVRRGMKIYKDTLCQQLSAPNIDLEAAVNEIAGPNASVREVVEARGNHSDCGACHQTPDPIGLAFESFDHLGRVRTEYENGEAIDTVASVPDIGAVQNASELSRELVESPLFQECFMERFSMSFMGQNVGKTKQNAWLDSVSQDMNQNARSLEEMVLEFVAHDGFIERKQVAQ